MKRTWTRIETGKLLKASDLPRFLGQGAIGEIDRHKGDTVAIGFAPIDDPMGSNFENCGIAGGKLWAWFVRVDRISVSAKTVRIKAAAFVRDGLPGLTDGERKAYEALKAKKRRAFVEVRVRHDLIMNTPAAINTIPVHYDSTTGILRVGTMSHAVVKFVFAWLEDIAVETIPVGQEYAPPRVVTPEEILIERFDGNPADLLDVVPGSFNGAANDGDQTEIDPDDPAGMKERLRHFKRDFLTWLAYRAVAGERIALPPAGANVAACTVDVEVGRTCSVKVGDRHFVDVNGADPVMDVSTRAALKGGAKIVRGAFGFVVGLESGAEKWTFDLDCNLGTVDVEAKTRAHKKAAGDDAIDDAADRVLEIDATIAQMQDAENLLRRLFVYFAILRSSARWSTERERMLNMLYTLDDVGRALPDPPINAGEMIDALTDFEPRPTAPAPASIF